MQCVLQFHQFSGRLGPTALAVDSKSGNIYVAHSDFAGVCAACDGPFVGASLHSEFLCSQE